MHALDCNSKSHKIWELARVHKASKDMQLIAQEHHRSDVPELGKRSVTTAIIPGDCCAAPLVLKPVELSPSTWTSSCCKRVASPEETEAF